MRYVYYVFMTATLSVAANGQTSDSYTGVSVSDDGSTVYAYTVTEGGMGGGNDCLHTYNAGIAFSTADWFQNFTPNTITAPVYQSVSVRQDASQTLDGVSDYFVRNVNSASCSCVGRTFYQEVFDNPLRKVRAYYYCIPSGGPCQITLGLAAYRRCNPNNTCDYMNSKPLNGATPPPFALKTVYQVQIKAILICSGFQSQDQTTNACASPDPIP